MPRVTIETRPAAGPSREPFSQAIPAGAVDKLSPSAGPHFLIGSNLTEPYLSNLVNTPLELPLPIRFAQPVTGAKTSREAPASRIGAKDRAMQAPTTSPHP